MAITTPPTSNAVTTACPREAELIALTMAGVWMPTRTNRAPLRMKVLTSQKPMMCTLAPALVTLEPAWLRMRPQVTTARTPETPSSCAGR